MDLPHPPSDSERTPIHIPCGEVGRWRGEGGRGETGGEVEGRQVERCRGRGETGGEMEGRKVEGGEAVRWRGRGERWRGERW